MTTFNILQLTITFNSSALPVGDPTIRMLLNKLDKVNMLLMFGTAYLALQGPDSGHRWYSASIDFSTRTSLSKPERPCEKDTGYKFIPNKLVTIAPYRFFA